MYVPRNIFLLWNVCVKCLNTVHTIEALRAAGVVVPQHVVMNRKKVIVTNNEPKEKKHDPNKLLLGYENAPGDLSSDIVINNCNTACIFRECNTCGLHKVYEHILLQNPNIVSRYSEQVIWYLWGSYKEEIMARLLQDHLINTGMKEN